MVDKKTDKMKQFLDRACGLLNCRPEIAVAVFSQRELSSLRINKLKAGDDTADLEVRLKKHAVLEPIPWFDKAFWILEGKDKLLQSQEYLSGLFTVQNASSLIPPLALNPARNSGILDACASPGIKASILSGITDNTASLRVNEPDHSRRKKMEKMLTELGVNYISSDMPAQFLNRLPDEYDFILVDAPCSGEGMIDLRNKDPLKYWSLKR